MRAIFGACLLTLGLLGCGGDDRPPAADPNNDPQRMEDDDGRTLDDIPSDEGADDGGDDGVDGDDDVEPGVEVDASLEGPAPGGHDAGRLDSGAPDAGPPVPQNCGDITCRGHGGCAVIDGSPRCLCDEGYIAEGELDEFECVVDTNCKRFRFLEKGCRQVVGGPPAVGTFFAVDYCAGTAVLPEDLGDLNEAFEILENGVDISENEESVATVIERDAESYVAIALDVSKSVTGVDGDTAKEQALRALIRELRDFVASLDAPAAEYPVTVSVLVFGRFVEEYIPFTTDLAAVDEALRKIQVDPNSVVELVGGDGTALYDATKRGIEAVERIQALRHLVTDTGVLTTGTLVVVTDGRDSSNADLDVGLIQDTRVNLISIGISGDIDDADLAAIGRDGSFLAPAQEDWANSFAEIAQRVDEYPDRTYLLAYCSSATTGSPTVSVRLRGEVVEETANCNFDAEAFSSDASDVCNLSLFRDSCDTQECGSFYACGACADGECCAGGACKAPAKTPQCRDQDALCRPAGEVCKKVEPVPEEEINRYICGPELTEGEECDENNDYCARGESYCAETDAGTECVPVVLENRAGCGDADTFDRRFCPELNCSQKSATNVTDPYECRREARIFERCSGSTADAECELGGRCKGSLCAARDPWECATHLDCLSGHCNTNTGYCVETGICPFSWDSKIETP